MTDKELMQQALEAMEYADACLKKQLTAKTKHEYAQDLLMTAGTALRERLSRCDRCGKPTGGPDHIHTCSPQARQEQEQEPVGWVDDGGQVFWKDKPPADDSDLYTAPQPAQQPLTEAKIQDLLGVGDPTDEEKRLVQLGWDAAHGITGEKK